MPTSRLHPEPGPAVDGDDRLESWKAIASHLQRDIRTLHRWELQEGLPIHRQMHRKRGSVFAYRSELDAWRASRAVVRPGPGTRRRMLAVLPFANLGADPDQDYLSDGLTEEMLAQVGHVHPEELGVIARTSVMRYKGSSATIADIGRELGVDYVLEGSVRGAAGRVRITAQLIRVSDQSHLWTESHDRDLGDVLLLQTEVAVAIARQIHVAVTAEGARRLSRARRVDPAAYEAYLKGRFHWYKLTREHLDLAQQYFERALEIDPGHAAAHAGLAYVWFSRGDCGFVAPRQAYAHASAAASKAIASGDMLAQVHELLGVMRLHHDWDWEGAERSLQRAIALDPNYADAHLVYADLLISVGRFQQAIEEMREALKLDPCNFLFRCFWGWHLAYLRRYDEAIAQLQNTLRTEPSYPAAHLGLWGAFSRTHRHPEALAAARRFFDLLGDQEAVAALTHGSADDGYAGAMRAAADVLERRSRAAHVPAVRIARLCAHAGQPERALDWLEKAYDQHESPLAHLRVAWDWEPVRTHRRFETLLRRMNFPAVPATGP